MRVLCLIFSIVTFLARPSLCQNKPEREAWLKDAGFGMFIHWSIDAQLGTVIGHSLVGASDDYTARFFNELPKTFNPKNVDPERWAILAKRAGMKYMMFTTKHIAGFCMWDTKTTDFNITNTPYGKDLVAQYIKACRKHGLAVGLYYCPEDFYFLHKEGELIKREMMKREGAPERSKEGNERYVTWVKAQVKELLSNYGEIDMMFLDGRKNFLIDALKPMIWEINPNMLITRGEIETPEQHLLGVTSDRVWEACMTMGTQWQFKPTNEAYKPTSKIIELLTETRAQGGALLLNIGPDAFGEVPFEQERNLTALAAWYFINKEAIDKVVPWTVAHEDDIWFTKARESNTVYAIIGKEPDWKRGTRKDFVLKSVKATENTKINVLGQSDKWVEYMPNVDATSQFKQTEKGLEVSVVRAQRIYNNHRWPNPIVIKLENVEPAFIPPVVMTKKVALDEKLQGELISLGDDKELEVGFYYRPTPEKLNDITSNAGWKKISALKMKKAGDFEVDFPQLPKGRYQFRAFATHDKLTVTGIIKDIDKK